MEGLPSIDVSNVLSEEKRQQVIALGRLGWPLRRIQQETGIRRETAGAYLKAAGIAIRAPGGWGRRTPAKPANEVSTDPSANGAAELGQNRPIVSPDPAPIPLPGRCPTSSACEPYFDFIELSLSKGRSMRPSIRTVDSHGFAGRWQRQTLCPPVARAAGESHVCGHRYAPSRGSAGRLWQRSDGARFRLWPGRSVRLFVLTLGYSRKAVRLLTFHSSTRIWAELHEQAFRRLGGACRTIVLDNLREGVLQPDHSTIRP